jgi:hypothetical protein
LFTSSELQDPWLGLLDLWVHGVGLHVYFLEQTSKTAHGTPCPKGRSPIAHDGFGLAMTTNCLLEAFEHSLGALLPQQGNPSNIKVKIIDDKSTLIFC